MSRDATDLSHTCKALKIKYVIRELKKKYSNPKQRIAIALSVSKKFCANPYNSVTKQFLNNFSEDDLISALGSKHVKRVKTKYGVINKSNMIKYILHKISE